jgi:hypothetical protein
MRAAADQFTGRLQAQAGSVELPPPPQPPHNGKLLWRNRLFAAGAFRRAHVELLEIMDHFAVVHVCVLPHLYSIAPIFGFDMIAGTAQATGIFLDFSPVTPAPPRPALADIVPADARAAFSQTRARPEWGAIFSPDFFAIRPRGPDEISEALRLSLNAFEFYLATINAAGAAPCPADPLVLRGHAAYACAQRQNPHTVRMLARYVGGDAARRFVDDVLFPMPG